MLLKAKDIKYQNLTVNEDFEEELLEDEYIYEDDDSDIDEIIIGNTVLLAGYDTRYLEEGEELLFDEEEDSEFPEEEIELDEKSGFIIGKPILIGPSEITEIEYQEEETTDFDEIDDFEDLLGDEIEEAPTQKKPATEGELLVDNFSSAITSLEHSLEMGIGPWKDVAVGRDLDKQASSVMQGYRSVKEVDYSTLEFITEDERDSLIGETAQLLSQARDFNTINKVLEDLENKIKEISEERCEYYKNEIYSEKDQTMVEIQSHVEQVINGQREIIQSEAEEYIEKTVQFYRQKMSEDDQLLVAANNIVSRREQILDESYSRSLKLIEEANEQAFRIIEDSNSAKDQAEMIKANAHNEGAQIEEQYRDEAEKIIADANIEAAKIIQNAEEQHQGIVESATQDGFNVGYQEGREEAIRENAQLLMDTTNALNELHAAFPAAVKENEGKLIKIAIMLSDAITKDEIIGRPEICVKILDRAIRRVSDLERVLIKVNPLDLDLILPKENYFKGILPDVQDFVITGHYAIPRGGCLIETNSGTIDAQFQSQLVIVEELFNKIRSEYDDSDAEESEEEEAA